MLKQTSLPLRVWTRKGLQRFLVLFFLELSIRGVQIAGISTRTDGMWMSQIARHLTDAVDGLLKGKRYLIHDRDPLFTVEFLATLAESGTESVKLPPRSPNLNSYAERFVRTIKRVLPGTDDSVRRRRASGAQRFGNSSRIITGERNHPGIGNLLIFPDPGLTDRRGPIQCRSRLSGMLNYYDRAA